MLSGLFQNLHGGANHVAESQQLLKSGLNMGRPQMILGLQLLSQTDFGPLWTHRLILSHRFWQILCLTQTAAYKCIPVCFLLLQSQIMYLWKKKEFVLLYQSIRSFVLNFRDKLESASCLLSYVVTCSVRRAPSSDIHHTFCNISFETPLGASSCVALMIGSSIQSSHFSRSWGLDIVQLAAIPNLTFHFHH